jgi:hypothetical protein
VAEKTNLALSLLTQIAGGTGALALDKTKPEWTLYVGGATTGFGASGDPNGVAIKPGAIAALTGLLAIAVLPGGEKMHMAKSAVANLVGGALVYEGVTYADQHLVPMLQSATSTTPAFPPGTAKATQGLPYAANAPMMAAQWQRMHRGPGAFETQAIMNQYRRVQAMQ